MPPSTALAPRPTPVPGRRLSGLAEHLGLPLEGEDAAVTGITHASDQVRPGDLYVGLAGQRTHGARFVDDALAHGAVGLLTDEAGRGLDAGRAPALLVAPDPRAALGPAAAWVYDFPARALTVYGVTGTNGKTTVTSLLHAVLTAVEGAAGLVGTITTRVGGRTVPSVRTTPEASDLHALLAVMREAGVGSVALEVSSHALVLGRVGGLVVDVAGFTNLSQDHLDFHGDMESYYAAKAALFTPEHSRQGVVVVDDRWGRRLAEEASVPVTTLTVLPDDPGHPLVRDAAWRVEDVVAAGAGSRARLHGPQTVVDLVVGIPGPVNVVNAALAVAMAVQGGIGAERAATALASAPPVPGRMQVVSPADPLVVVDYAHTPDAITSALATLRATAPGPLVVVVGAGGDRDAGKRPLMGEAAALGADVVVVTDDNPRSEDPSLIRAAVREGAAQAGRARVLEVADRAAAIEAALAAAASAGPAQGGCVLVAGKGHEQGQEVAGVVHPFDDVRAVQAALAARTHGAVS